MAETPAQSLRLTCPRCGETILSEDKYCFHCGRRLQSAVDAGNNPPRSRFRFPQWPLALVGIVAIAFAAYEVHHQSQVMAHLQSTGAGSSAVNRTGRRAVALHPVVTTTTTYPANLPSSASWTSEVETYRNVQFGLRVPVGMNTLLPSSSGSQWAWGEPNTPYKVVLSVVPARPAGATVALGPKTFGTAITRSGAVASQSLYINWAAHTWVQVSMAVPASHIYWLGSIAESVRVS